MLPDRHPLPLRRPAGRLVVLAWLVLLAAPTHALGLMDGLPGPAEETARLDEVLGSYALPIGPWTDGSMLTQALEGRIERSAWRIAAPGATTLELLAPLRDGYLRDGWRLLFDCDGLACGGFDFRYSTLVLPEPAMHVDLADFRFVAMRKGSGEAVEHLSLLVSRSAGAGHIQKIRVLPAGAPDRPTTRAVSTMQALTLPDPGLPDRDATAPVYVPAGSDRFADEIEAGTVALDDLEFDVGAATLAKGNFASLVAIADYLAAHPDRAVVLVGHTDASGGLAGNIALSKRRAEAVRARLIADHAVRPAQVSAEGVGYLAPRDSNLTEEGRTRNRRVEAMLASTR